MRRTFGRQLPVDFLSGLPKWTSKTCFMIDLMSCFVFGGFLWYLLGSLFKMLLKERCHPLKHPILPVVFSAYSERLLSLLLRFYTGVPSISFHYLCCKASDSLHFARLTPAESTSNGSWQELAEKLCKSILYKTPKTTNPCYVKPTNYLPKIQHFKPPTL